MGVKPIPNLDKVEDRVRARSDDELVVKVFLAFGKELEHLTSAATASREH